MILEVATLDVKPGVEAAFEAAMREARPLIAGSTGFLGMEVRRCLEARSRYMLLVRWNTLEDHTEGFRKSERYQQWRAKLHHFYDPAPLVQHYAEPFASA